MVIFVVGVVVSVIDDDNDVVVVVYVFLCSCWVFFKVCSKSGQ